MPKWNVGMKNARTKRWWNWLLGSISASFYARFFLQYFCDKKLQNVTVKTIIEKICAKHSSTKNACVKCWWNWPLLGTEWQRLTRMPERATLRKREMESNKFEKLKFTIKLFTTSGLVEVSGNKLNTSKVKQIQWFTSSNFIFL